MAKIAPHAENISAARPRSTKEAILAATCELVARQGIQGTTVRDITAASGANVAAVNYHFQSKDNLVELATRQITEAVNEAREAQLDAALTATGGAPLSAHQILRALILPVLTVSRAADGGSLYARVSSQLRTARYADESLQHFHHFGGTARRILGEMARSFPELPRDELVAQYEFARGAVLHLAIGLDPMFRRFELLASDEARPLPETPQISLTAAHLERLIAMLLTSFGRAAD